MKTTFKKRLKKLILSLVLLFVFLLGLRLSYEYTKASVQITNQGQFLQNITNSKRNYASKKYEQVRSTGELQNTTKTDQKYEKIAEIKTQSSKFEQEEKVSRKQIQKYNALIQYEQKSGNRGYRKLNLVIGVPPQHFDSLYNQLIKIGKIQAKQITKNDKTNEYKELNAKKASLEKIRASLIELKSKGGKIDEYMGLENRILEIEQQLQGLGVSLGDFDDENEFCTVQFSLSEGRKVEISFMQHLMTALDWTITTYLQLMAALFFLTLFAYLFLLAVDKLKIMEKIVNDK